MVPFGLTHNHLKVSERHITLKRLSPALHGLKIVQISDLHFYEHSDAGYFQKVQQTVNALNPDILVMTGDAVHIGSKHVEQAGQFLASLSARYGKFAILGNHDYDDGFLGECVKKQLIASGFTLLINGHQQLSISPKNGSANNALYSITLAGLDDLWYGKPDIQKTLEGIADNEPVVLLAHNPLLFDPVAIAYPGQVDLILAGHTHAGHVYIPVLAPVYRRIFRMKYRYGLFEKNGTILHVTSGIGSAAFALKKQNLGFPRFRWNTCPEVAVLNLLSPSGSRLE